MPSISDNEDDLLEALEADDDDVSAAFRERRMAELKMQMDRLAEMKQKRYGEYTQVKSDKELLEITTKEKKVVVHFFMKDFKRCAIVDAHLQKLAPKYPFTKFIKASVDDCPFIVARLQVKVLPCVFSFVESAGVDRLVGFEELGNTDKFRTEILEQRLLNCGVISRNDNNRLSVINN